MTEWAKYVFLGVQVKKLWSNILCVDRSATNFVEELRLNYSCVQESNRGERLLFVVESGVDFTKMVGILNSERKRDGGTIGA